MYVALQMGATVAPFLLGLPNSAASGGAVQVEPQTINHTVRIYNCNFSGNEAVGAGGSGGAVQIVEDDIRPAIEIDLQSNVFSNNVAAASGGAVCINDVASTAIVSNCLFVSNSAGVSGGALFADAHDLTVKGESGTSLFEKNRAVSAGGGIYWNQSPEGSVFIRFFATTFRQNAANGGGAVAFELSSSEDAFSVYQTILGCTFYQNRADGRAAALSQDGGAFQTRGSIGENQLLALAIINTSFRSNISKNSGGATAFFVNNTGLGECVVGLTSAV